MHKPLFNVTIIKKYIGGILKMATTITFINEKGGVGKSQTQFSIAWELSLRGKKVLIIDMDGQRANISYMCGVKKSDDMATMFNVLQMNLDPTNAIVNIRENFDIIPGTNALSGITQAAKSKRMKEVISQLGAAYDYIFIDVSPSPDWRQYLTLSACDYAIIVMLPDMASLEANNGIIESIEELQEGANPNLKIMGILINRNENRSNMGKTARSFAEKFAQALNTKVFKTTVRNAVSMGESAYSHIGITEYDSSSDVAKDIRSITDELEGV